MNHEPVNIYPLLWLIGMALAIYPIGKFGRWVDIKMGQSACGDWLEYVGVGFLWIAMTIGMVGLILLLLVGLYDMVFYGVEW